MKKSLAVALLIATLGGAVFAQNLVFSGYVNSGLGIGFNDADGSDPFIAARAVDSEQNGYRFRLNGQYTNEAKTAGARFRFQNQGGSTTPTVSHVWGWMNFFNGVLQLNGGRIEDSSFATGDFWLSSDSTSRMMGDGVLLKLMPIEGLALGVGVYVTGRDGSQFFQDLKNAKITGHLSYTMKDVFRFDVSYRTNTGSAVSGTSGDGPSMLFADFRLLAIKNLTAVAAVHFNNLQDYSALGAMSFSETFGYKINDSLNIGLNAVQFLSNTANYDIGLFFNPWLAYSTGSIIPRLDLVYMMAGRSNFISTAQIITRDANWFRHGFNAAGNKDFSVINIRPSVSINIDNRTKLEIGDSFYIDFYKAGNDQKSLLTNVFYIDMVLSF